jgi:diadenylate cyclase
MREILDQFNLWAILDIAIVAFVIYQALLLIRGTRAAQMLIGILFVGLAFLISTMVPLTTLNWMMNKFYSSFIIILIIIFQDDIRHVLSRMGKKSFIPGADRVASHHVLDEIVRAATSMASKRIGGLIVIERNIILGRYVDVGILIDARISKELLVSIFHPSSPIHDGAVIIQRGRVAAAGCFLPLTREENIDPNMGTRHRAGIGISQETDAVVVLVSEEIGAVALIVDGKVSRKLDARQLREQLNDLLIGDEEISSRKTEASSGGATS